MPRNKSKDVWSKMFRDVKNNQEDIERFVKDAGYESIDDIDFGSPTLVDDLLQDAWRKQRREMGEQKTAHRRRLREVKREQLLRRVESRICPVCEEKKFKSKQWVLLTADIQTRLELKIQKGEIEPLQLALKLFQESGAICKSCYFKYVLCRS